MKLIIGCPIYKRDWIFPAWAAAIERQSVNISDIGFVFITSSNDEKTIKCIDVWKNIHPETNMRKIPVNGQCPNIII
jgi:hypothetical protein